MAQDIQFCLVWTSELPRHRRSRKSSYFRMFGEEWYLHAWMPGVKRDSCNTCYVHLFRRGGPKVLETPFNITATCDVLAGERVLKSFVGVHPVTVRHSRAVLLKFEHPPSVQRSEYWKVCCRICSGETLSLQVDNEAIQLSTLEGDPTPPEIRRGSSEEEATPSSRGVLEEHRGPPDFELRCGGRTFPVHRSLLSARSDVFAALIREAGSVDIEDLEAPVLESLLKFVYSGRLEDEEEEDTAASLYEAAARYALHPLLRSACSSWMIRHLTEENCLRHLLAADFHSDPDLKTAAVSFVAKHPEVLKGAAWCAISKERPVLAVEVLNTYVSATSQ